MLLPGHHATPPDPIAAASHSHPIAAARAFSIGEDAPFAAAEIREELPFAGAKILCLSKDPSLSRHRLPYKDATPWVSIGATTAAASPPADALDPAVVDSLYIISRRRGVRRLPPPVAALEGLRRLLQPDPARPSCGGPRASGRTQRLCLPCPMSSSTTPSHCAPALTEENLMFLEA
ncbi:uncharacterized protein [Triticum aestivum]|uniref:uncharacterized protein n=1 Tax=Triticum aestivum TaxID=4565 RepID=UPI001D01B56E|nr:uncharacterized protein LOC123070153 [Triticum aestivum]